MINHRVNKLFVLLLVVIGMGFMLFGCKGKVNIIGISDYYYNDSEQYMAGEAELTETVENIEIDWMVGNVTLMSHPSNTVSFSEKSERKLTEDIQLHYWLNDKTLYIKFCSCGKWDLSELEKELTILVPDTLILSNLKVNTLSADINLSACGVSQQVKFNTLSGKLEANLIQPLYEFQGNSTSGSFQITAPSVSHFDVESVSGEVQLSVQKEPDWLNIDTTSGNIKLILPESSSFKIDYDTTSGVLYSNIAYRKSGRKYIFGDGHGTYEIVSVSGDVKITKSI